MRRIIPFWSQVRNYTAIASAFIYNLDVFGISAKNICSPGFNCHGCPWATFSCPVGVIGYGFGVRAIPAFALGSVLAVGIVLGRLVCGYACPFGLLQDLLYRIKTRKFSMPGSLRYLKYIVLLLTVFLLTYIFGFDVDEGYIRIDKPIVAKDTPELDQTIFAEKNRSYFTGGNYTVTEGGFPVPENIGGAGKSSGLSPVGFGGDDPFSLDSLAEDSTGDPFAEAAADKNRKDDTLSPVGLGGGGVFEDILGEDTADASVAVPVEGESVFDLLTRSKDEEFKNSTLLVEVSVENMSPHDVDGFVLTPVYYEHGTGLELWRGEDKLYNYSLKPGETFTTEIFTVPYYLHKADIAVLSPQTSVVMNYWNLFCTYCPLAALEADIPSELAGLEGISDVAYLSSRINMLRLAITVVVIVLSVIISRFFCRGLCPLGAMYGLIARFAVFKIKLEKDKCIDCGKCDSVCPVELDVRKEVGGSECLSCGDCVKSCPVAALKRKVGV